MSSNSDEINDLENEPGSDDETADDAAADLRNHDDPDVTDVIESHAPDTEPVHPDHTWAVPLTPGQVIEHHWETTIDGDDS
jgi:hypothetical protein